MRLSEQTKIEAQMGFTIGILIGAISAWVLITFTTSWEWYFKVFSSIGSFGIIGMLSMSLWELVKVRRNYLDSKMEVDKLVNDFKQGLKGGKDEKSI